MLPDEQRDLRIAAIVVSLLACGGLRFAGVGDHGPLELVPVLLAAVWFGRRSAFVVTVIASVVAATSEVLDGMVDWSVTGVHIALLALAAYVVSRLADRARAREAELQQIRPLQDVLAPR